jgi:hypothetical protein
VWEFKNFMDRIAPPAYISRGLQKPQRPAARVSPVLSPHNAGGVEQGRQGLSASPFPKLTTTVLAPPAIDHYCPPKARSWIHPRFVFDSKSGFPMFWISGRCVLITWMVLYRF